MISKLASIQAAPAQSSDTRATKCKQLKIVRHHRVEWQMARTSLRKPERSLQPHAGIQRRLPSYRKADREVLVATVHQLELAAVNRDQGAPEQTDLTAQPHDLRVGSQDRRAIIFPEVRDRLVVGRKPPRQPHQLINSSTHQLDIAPSLALQPTAGLHLVQVAIDVELEQRCRMVGRTSCGRRRHALKTQDAQTMQTVFL